MLKEKKIIMLGIEHESGAEIEQADSFSYAVSGDSATSMNSRA